MCLNLESYSMVTYGASCEEIGLATVTSLDDCNKALQELGLDHTPRGTVGSTFRPSGCFLNADGDLWYNLNGQSTAQCTSQSSCICWNGEHLELIQGSAKGRAPGCVNFSGNDRQKC